MAAIYQWFGNQAAIIVTTTLYPLDAADNLAITGAPVDEGWLTGLPEETGYHGISVLWGSLSIVRFDAPEQGPESGYFGIENTLTATLDIIRFDAPEQGPESGYFGIEVPPSATLIGLVIDADSPDEELEITCTPVDEGWLTLA